MKYHLPSAYALALNSSSSVLSVLVLRSSSNPYRPRLMPPSQYALQSPCSLLPPGSRILSSRSSTSPSFACWRLPSECSSDSDGNALYAPLLDPRVQILDPHRGHRFVVLPRSIRRRRGAAVTLSSRLNAVSAAWRGRVVQSEVEPLLFPLAVQLGRKRSIAL